MAEHGGEHPFESNMPPRESSLDDFEKLENYCIEAKLDDDVGNLLGDFGPPQTDSQVLVAEKDPFLSHKESQPAPVKPEDKSYDLKDFDAYHGTGGNRYLGKLVEQEETSEKSSKDELISQKNRIEEMGLRTSNKHDVTAKPEPIFETMSSGSFVPPVASQLIDTKIQEQKPMQSTASKPAGPVPTQAKSTEKEQVSEKKKGTEAQEKQEVQVPTSTCKECPFSPGALFDIARLNPVVSNLVYWRDLTKSGIVFGAILFLLLTMRFFSLISISAYLALATLGLTISFRIYKNILQAVQKSTDGHPFRDYLEMDIALPEEKARDLAVVVVNHFHCAAKRIRSLFLVEDLVDSIKLGILLWLTTYVGAWFNGLTLFTIAFVAAFTVPKVYETYKAQIDQYLDIACTQVTGVLQIIKSKLPFGQKDKQQ